LHFKAVPLAWEIDNEMPETYSLGLLNTVEARRNIAILNLAILAIFVSVEQLFSYFRYPTPGPMFLIAAIGILLRVIELLSLRHRSAISVRASRALAGASIGWNLSIPFLLAAATRQFHTHYFGLLILPVLEAALYFSFAIVLCTCSVASACVVCWVGYAADFTPPFQLGELLEAATLVLIFFIVGPLIWWLVNLLAQREEQLRHRLSDLEQARSQLIEEEKLAAVGRLASAVAHEIRNPVAIISNALEAASSKLFSAQERAEMSGIAVGEARRLEKLTTDFLTYAQPGISTFVEIDPVTVVGYITSIARAQAMGKSVLFEVRTDEGCVIRGHEGQLQQALLNVLLNAVDASPEFGRVAVEVKRIQADVKISVQNEGPAIPPDAVPKIFEPFFTAKPGGTGLGLAIAKRIAEKHNGRLVLEQNDSKIRFVFTLPLKPEAGRSRSDAAKEAHYVPHPGH
jgi:signal transduction histidine kinase